MKKFCKLATCLLVVGFVFICGVFAQNAEGRISQVSGKLYKSAYGYTMEFAEDDFKFCFRYHDEKYWFGTYSMVGDICYFTCTSGDAKNCPEQLTLKDGRLLDYNPSGSIGARYTYEGRTQLRNQLSGTSQVDGKFVFTDNKVTVNAYNNSVIDYTWNIDTADYKTDGYPPTKNTKKFLGYIGKKAEKNFKAENENEMSYEQGFWLSLRTEYGENFLDEKKMQETYLEVYHPEEYAAVKNDQFALYDKLITIKPEMEQKYAEVISSEDATYSIRGKGVFDEYDFDKQEFTIKIDYNSFSENTSIINPKELNFNEKIGVSLSDTEKLFDASRGRVYYVKYPVELAEARELNKKEVLVILYYTPTFKKSMYYYDSLFTLKCLSLSYELYDSPETMVKLK